MSEIFKSGIVALVGKPNVGKSSLINRIIGEKIAIVSDKPQTTRNRIGGIYTTDQGQIVFYDTPGIHKPLHKLGQYILKVATSSLLGVDLLLVMVDPTDGLRESDRLVATHVNGSHVPVFLVINKIDAYGDRKLLENFSENASRLFENVLERFYISAEKGTGVDSLIEAIFKFLPAGKMLFPEDYITDRSSRFMASEIVREKVLQHTRQEIPHSVGVSVHEFKDEGDLLRIRADIVVERNSQKPIILGKGGSMIKLIGSDARRDMEYIFDQKVFLDLFVKVREKWRDKDSMIQEFTNLKDELS
ncbi:MAG TPA: GTPase Era [Mesotoga sp.]|jgi:GTP-binding protein Era|nr:GTPase Era [Mesotoga sp.]MDI9374108.1 GTPase Era [Thermotogota bacterium]NLX32909.1 GTPase Era [Thermotogaceae bacterium]MDD4040939.1 GTPase Era [Mesotoga sp.]MDD5743546.1 GTPase Era [Mesotoga sp.]